MVIMKKRELIEFMIHSSENDEKRFCYSVTSEGVKIAYIPSFSSNFL
jgi:hypothetical protein